MGESRDQADSTLCGAINAQRVCWVFIVLHPAFSLASQRQPSADSHIPITLSSPRLSLVFLIFDKDRHNKDDYLGFAAVALTDLHPKQDLFATDVRWPNDVDGDVARRGRAN